MTEVEGHRRPVVSELAGQFVYLCGGDAGFGRGPFGGVGLDEPLQLRESFDPAFHIGRVIELFPEDDVDEAVVERQIGSRADLQEAGRPAGRGGHPRIDVGQPGTPVQSFDEVVHGPNVDGFEEVVAVEHHVPAVLVVRGHVGHRVAEEAVGGRPVRPPAQGVVSEMVGGSDGGHERLVDMGADLNTLGASDAGCPVRVDDPLEFVGHDVEGLVPARLAELAGTPGSHPDHGMLEPLVVVDEGRPCNPPGAQAPLHARHMGVALDEPDLIVLHGHLDRAAYRTHKTQAVNLAFHSLLLNIA